MKPNPNLPLLTKQIEGKVSIFLQVCLMGHTSKREVFYRNIFSFASNLHQFRYILLQKHFLVMGAW